MPEPIIPPPGLPPRLQPVTPVLLRRGAFIPEVGKDITVSLPGEEARCKILEVLSPNAIVVECGMTANVAKLHNFIKGSKVAVQRDWLAERGEVWVPIDERAVREQEAVDRMRQQVAAEQTRKAAEARGIDLAEAPEPEPEVYKTGTFPEGDPRNSMGLAESFKQTEEIVQVNAEQGTGHTTPAAAPDVHVTAWNETDADGMPIILLDEDMTLARMSEIMSSGQYASVSCKMLKVAPPLKVKATRKKAK